MFHIRSLLFACFFILSCALPAAQAEQTLQPAGINWYATENALPAATKWADDLQKQGISMCNAPISAPETSAPVLVFFGSVNDPNLTPLLQKALGVEEQANLVQKSFQGMLMKENIWASPQQVFFFLGATNSGLRNAIDNSRETWSGVLSSLFRIQLSQDSFYGY